MKSAHIGRKEIDLALQGEGGGVGQALQGEGEGVGQALQGD